jgi:NAD+ kinase
MSETNRGPRSDPASASGSTGGVGGLQVLLVAHHERGEAGSVAEKTVEWLGANGHRGWLLPEDAAALGMHELAGDTSPCDADLVVSLGGDGTMLRAVHLLDGAAVPLLGVNLGWLGYLTEVESDGLADALARFAAGPTAGRWHLDERLMLEVVAEQADGTHLGTWRALNEAVIEKWESGHTVRLMARIDGERFTTYAADGLIVATPTGSTAYSLSARGPVVSPRHRALLLTPVAPHMLFDRSLVLDPSESVELEVLGHRPAQLSVDGRLITILREGDMLRCVPSAATACFVRFSDVRYHQVLKEKFGLSDR